MTGSEVVYGFFNTVIQQIDVTSSKRSGTALIIQKANSEGNFAQKNQREDNIPVGQSTAEDQNYCSNSDCIDLCELKYSDSGRFKKHY